MRSHGEARSSRTAEYKIWTAMMTRCFNARATGYKTYGVLGITVAPEWRTYPGFLVGLLTSIGRRPTLRHTLDRIDGRQGYVPGNLRWATGQEQQRNRLNNHLITYRGETLYIAEWAERYTLPFSTVWDRLATGWTPERAFCTPVRQGRPERCKHGHLLADTGRFEGESRRCTTCKRQYDKSRRQQQAVERGCLPPLVAVESSED